MDIPSRHANWTPLRISGWFRITLVASVLCVLAATWVDDDDIVERAGHYFVVVIIAISALRVMCLAADWIAAGFSATQLRRILKQGKVIAMTFGIALLLYLAAPALRYSIVGTAGESRFGAPAYIIVLDRVSGEAHRLKMAPDHPKSPWNINQQQPVL